MQHDFVEKGMHLGRQATEVWQQSATAGVATRAVAVRQELAPGYRRGTPLVRRQWRLRILCEWRLRGDPAIEAKGDDAAVITVLVRRAIRRKRRKEHSPTITSHHRQILHAI